MKSQSHKCKICVLQHLWLIPYLLFLPMVFLLLGIISPLYLSESQLSIKALFKFSFQFEALSDDSGDTDYFSLRISIHCCCCSVPESRLTLCDLVHCSTPDFPVLHYLPAFAQSNVPQVSDAIQPSHPLLSPSPLALNLSHHQGLFQ